MNINEEFANTLGPELGPELTIRWSFRCKDSQGFARVNTGEDSSFWVEMSSVDIARAAAKQVFT